MAAVHEMHGLRPLPPTTTRESETAMTLPANVTVVNAPRPFHLEIDHYRNGVWLGTTFQRGEYAITYLANRDDAASVWAFVDWAEGERERIGGG